MILHWADMWARSASLWGCELKWNGWWYLLGVGTSASLWGCELKSSFEDVPDGTYSQPPCEAVSWNMICSVKMNILSSQPPCEAVSWNSWDCKSIKYFTRQPPCEAVSWNIAELRKRKYKVRQPPCEAVSWNKFQPFSKKQRKVSASLWGCELKFWQYVHLHWTYHVSLLVRLWVEMLCMMIRLSRMNVSLLVRLWVEILMLSLLYMEHWSASLWGCELKCFRGTERRSIWSQPPCEAVSWNAIPFTKSCPHRVSLLVRLWVEIFQKCSSPGIIIVSLLVRLWVEMLINTAGCVWRTRQPPCEAVSWNIFVSSILSVSRVSLLVRLWVEMNTQAILEANHWSASLWGCELKFPAIVSPPDFRLSASLWGCELK